MLRFTDRSAKSEGEYGDVAEVFGDDEAPLLPSPEETARSILTDVMRFRRFSGKSGSCDGLHCSHCLAPHLAKVTSAVALGLPVTFVLPAFPGKSPNLAKVLGPLPDMAERRALEFLQRLCDRIQDIYAPGARVILCSDGRVFSDVVGMRDEDVSAYQRELSTIISEAGLTSISTFNLDELYVGSSRVDLQACKLEYSIVSPK